MTTNNAIRNLIQKASLVYPMAKRWLHVFNGGVFLKYNKSLSLQQPIRETIIPDHLILPLKQTIGHKADLLVTIGSHVQKNQLLTKAADENRNAVIVPIHAPTSGTIIAIESHVVPHASGLKQLSIILKPDFKDTPIENILKVSGEAPTNPQQIKSILLNAGIVGMGGAGFPTYAKLPMQKGKIKTLIINGAECEPFITCDDLLMQTRANDIIQGAVMVANALGCEQIICGIESNKPEAISIMKQAAQGTIVTIKVVETVYPMGGEKQLIQELTGTEIPVRTHAIDSGLLMFNVATYAAMFRALRFGEPLTSRLVTVSGFGLTSAYNTYALMGTPFETLANAGRPKQPIDYPLVMGGPMMGFKVQSNQVPVVKTTNCILVNPPQSTQDQMACIRCGECMDACPMNLLPQQMFWHSQAHEFEKAEKLNIFDCIECGCCSYVCPSNIPLVQYYRHAKSEIKTLHAEQQATELAKQRHEFKLARVEREKQEREARLKAKKEAVKKKSPPADSENAAQTTAKKPSAAAAAARAAAAKRAASAKGKSDNSESESPKEIPAARRKAIEMAQKSAAAKTGSKLEATKDPRVSAKKAAARKAAMAAAKRKAETKSETDHKTSDDNLKTAEKAVEQVSEQIAESVAKQDPKVAAREAAMAAAKRRVQAKKEVQTAAIGTTDEAPLEETQDSKPDLKPDPKVAAREAAMAAAKRRAQAKKEAQTTVTDTVDEPLVEEKKDPKLAAREAAMAAAKKRAAERKAKNAENT